MRVLLVQPDPPQSMGLQQMARLEPLGLEMIAGAVRDRHEVLLLDLRFAHDALLPTLFDFRPDLVGISSTFTVDAYQALRVARTVKANNPHTFVLVGGHHPSLRPVDFCHPAVDAIAVGEGELTVKELAECLAARDDPARVPGLVLNRPKQQHFSAPRPLVKNLDTLPDPDRSLTRAYRQYYHLLATGPIAALETTRGCHFHCRFCSVWRFYQQRVRFRSCRRVVEELGNIEQPEVFFTDDHFLADIGHAREIADMIRKRGIRKGYIIQARSDVIARCPEVLAQWRELGLHSVFIGFEKPDQAGLEKVAKHSLVEHNERALEVLRQVGIEPVASFIVDPDWDRGDFRALRDYVRRLKLRMPAFTVLTPLPGTTLFEETMDKLVTANYELFDLFHSVLPTRLPLPQFYKEIARLWRRSYPRWKLALLRVYCFLRRLWSWHWTTRYWRKVLAEGRHLRRTQSYLNRGSRLDARAQWQSSGCCPGERRNVCEI